MTIKELFRSCLPYCYDMHEIQYTDDILDNNAEELWKEYGDDIIEHIVGRFSLDISNHFTEETEVSSAYLWIDLMCEAMQANAESLFDAEGSCDIYGELI